MRNEGPFILEWVAWQKMLGFEHILVLYNNCTDNSPKLLALLQKAGIVTAQEHKPPKGVRAQRWAFDQVRAHPLVEKAEWLLICDVDEFLVIHKGDGRLADLLPAGQPPFAGMAVHWRVFGDNGVEEWQDGFVRHRFTRAAWHIAKQNFNFKSLIHRPRRFQAFGTHSPHVWLGAELGEGQWGEGANHWVLSDGQKFAEFDPDDNRIRGTSPDLITHEVAQINHYILQSRERFNMKKGVAKAAGGADRHTDDFYQRFNKNDDVDHSAMQYEAQFKLEHAKLTAIPGVLRLHHLCCADFISTARMKRGQDPLKDKRYIYHRAQAAALPRS